jgi:lipopolysaccharide export system permease protein
MSPRDLAKPAVLLASWSLALGLLLTLWLQPLANQELVRLQYFVQSQFSAALLKEGTFNDLGNRMTVYVARREQNAELHGILIHDGRNRDKPITIRAARGQMVQGGQGPQVIVYDGVQQEYDHARHRLSELSFDSYAVSLESLVPDTTKRIEAPRERSTLALWRGMTEEPEANMRMRLASELHQRLTTPFLSLAFVLIAACCLLFGEFSRRGQGKRVVLAIFLAALTQAAVLGFGQMSGQSLVLAVPIYLSVLLPILFCGGMIWKSGQEENLAEEAES